MITRTGTGRHLVFVALAAVAFGAAAQEPASGDALERERSEARLMQERDEQLAQERNEQLARERARQEAERAEQAGRARREAARAQARAERAADEAGHRAALERARAELEAAAREVADLSARLSAPVIAEAAERLGSSAPRAMLGIVIEDAAEGARVLSVTPGGPGDESGIESGDVIVSLAGETVAGGDERTSAQRLSERMARSEPGEPLALVVSRDGVEHELTVTPARGGAGVWIDVAGRTLPDFADLRLRDVTRAPWESMVPQFRMLRAFNDWQSMQLVELTPELGSYFGTEQGLLVIRGPDRDELGLRDGDVILDIGGREPSSPEHAMRILASFEPGETLSLSIMREGGRELIEFEVPDPEEDRDGG